MRLSIFKKASSLIPNVTQIGEGRDRIFFEINDKSVILQVSDGKTTIFSCDCEHCSVHQGVSPNLLCSHRLAVMGYLMKLNKMDDT